VEGREQVEVLYALAAEMARAGFAYQRDFIHAGRRHRLHRLRGPS
jgi:hypothetical protein